MKLGRRRKWRVGIRKKDDIMCFWLQKPR